MDMELKKKVRFLVNCGWYKDISGNYSHQAYYGLTLSVEGISAMSWEDLRVKEQEMRKYL